MSTAHVFELSGDIDLLGIRFKPGAVGGLSGIPAKRLVDTAAPVSDLPKSLPVNAAQLSLLNDTHQRTALVIAALRARLANIEEPDHMVSKQLTA